MPAVDVSTTGFALIYIKNVNGATAQSTTARQCLGRSNANFVTSTERHNAIITACQ